MAARDTSSITRTFRYDIERPKSMVKAIQILHICVLSLYFSLGINPSVGASILSGISDEQSKNDVAQVQNLLHKVKNKKISWSKRKAAAVKIRRYRLTRTHGAIDGLLKLLINPDDKTRALAAYAFEGREAGPYTEEDNNCRIDISKLLNSKEPKIRISAVKALGSFYKYSMTTAGMPPHPVYGERARAQLQSALNDEDLEVKKIAEDTVTALNNHAPTPLEQEVFLYDTGVVSSNQRQGY